MAQLRQDYPELQQQQVEVLVVGPDSPEEFRRYWKKENLSFLGLPDPDQKVLGLYGQEFNWLRLGRMPAQILIDRKGTVRAAHYGRSMTDIPSPAELLKHLPDED